MATLFGKSINRAGWRMECLVKRFFLLICLSWVLAGCSTITYEFVPPATESGRLCVTQCAAVRESCMANAQAQATREYERCERSNDQEFTRCLILADTKEKKAACEKRRRYFGEYVNDEPCEERYRSCFQVCGGRVIEREE